MCEAWVSNINIKFPIHTPGEFGVVYKAHLVKFFQQQPDIVAVKTLKGYRLLYEQTTTIPVYYCTMKIYYNVLQFIVGNKHFTVYPMFKHTKFLEL